MFSVTGILYVSYIQERKIVLELFLHASGYNTQSRVLKALLIYL